MPYFTLLTNHFQKKMHLNEKNERVCDQTFMVYICNKSAMRQGEKIIHHEGPQRKFQGMKKAYKRIQLSISGALGIQRKKEQFIFDADE